MLKLFKFSIIFILLYDRKIYIFLIIEYKLAIHLFINILISLCISLKSSLKSFYKLSNLLSI